MGIEKATFDRRQSLMEPAAKEVDVSLAMDTIAEVSTAISLKRIADTMDAILLEIMKLNDPVELQFDAGNVHPPETSRSSFLPNDGHPFGASRRPRK